MSEEVEEQQEAAGEEPNPSGGAEPAGEARTQPQVGPFADGGDSPEESPSPGQNLEMLLDLPLELSVELGRTRMSLQEMLKLDKGSVIRLGRTEGEPLEIKVNGRTVGRGEVVVVNDRLGIRVTEIGEARDRVRILE